MTTTTTTAAAEAPAAEKTPYELTASGIAEGRRALAFKACEGFEHELAKLREAGGPAAEAEIQFPRSPAGRPDRSRLRGSRLPRLQSDAGIRRAGRERRRRPPRRPARRRMT